MRITVSSRFHTEYPGGRYSPIESAMHLKKIGFEGIDFCMNEYVDVLDSETREKEISALREYAEKNDLSLDMCHLPFYNKKDERIINRELNYRLVCDGIDGASLLGVKNGVIHVCPLYAGENEYDSDVFFAEAVKYITPIAEYAEKKNVRLSFENMCNYKYDTGIRRFGCQTDEVCRVADYFGAGVCFDTGHANSVHLSMEDSLREIGSRLTALHINDNNGKTDEHLFPFFGNIKWTDFMTGLRAIDYKGNFNFEVKTVKIPKEIRNEVGAYVLALGKRLQEL